MTEEEKEAIEYIKKEIDYFKTTILGFEKEMEDKDWLRKNVLELKNDISARETILNLIQKQDTEINSLKEIIEDFKSGAGAAELARRKELEIAREKLDKANKDTKEAQKSIEERDKTVLEKYEAIKSASDEESFSIEEALNPTASLEDIMKDIFKKKWTKD